MKYLQVQSGTELPEIIGMDPFRSVIILEESVTSEWQERVSDWLINSGCLYMMAWGENCSAWDDSIDHSNLKKFKYGEIPEDKFVMTTWHDNESLKDVFWFSKHSAFHSIVNISNTLLLHISKSNKEEEYLDEYKSA